MPRKKSDTPPERTSLAYHSHVWRAIRKSLIEAYDAAEDHKKRDIGAVVNLIDPRIHFRPGEHEIEMDAKQRNLIYRHVDSNLLPARKGGLF